jgi:outer membrane protein assembly factor BamD
MKPDRDSTQAQLANEECRNLLEQYPNSKFAPRTEQRLRNIQEVLARGEYGVGEQYFKRGNFVAAANRLETAVNTYPLFSQADEALWMTAQSYGKLGTAFKERSANSYARILRTYPLSAFADLAKKELERMEKEIPEADPLALAHMKFEIENKTNTGIMHSFWGMFKTAPDMTAAAKSGTPSMTTFQPGVPVTVPGSAAELAGAPTTPATGGVNDITIAPVTGNSALDNQPDARQNQQKPQEPPR